MYDLKNDPEERSNLYVPENPGEAQALLQELDALARRYRAESPIAAADGAQPSEQELDEDTAEAMRDIGYLH